MKITHGNAIGLEHIVRTAWGFNDRGHLYGMIDADHFESHPLDAVCLLIAPFEYHHHEVHNDKHILSVCDGLCYIGKDHIDQEGMKSRTALTEQEEQDLFESVYSLSDYLKAHYPILK